MKNEIIEIERELIQESGIEPQAWIDQYAEDYRAVVAQLTREGYVLNKWAINLLLTSK